ncbi:LicD family protein, partial [Chloroflexota bacterium]
IGGYSMEKNNTADEAALKKSIEVLEPIERTTAEEILREIKQILDKLGVTFFLRKGTCLGVIRSKEFIPWDDDIDIGSVIGCNRLTEKTIEQVITALKEKDYLTQIDYTNYAIYVIALKSSIRVDWMVLRIINGDTFHWPGVRIPARFFTDTKEIDFIGEKFRVPNPAEEYLRFMYGPEWKIPRRAGSYEKAVLEQIPEDSLPGHAGKLKQFTINYLMPWLATRIKVLNSDNEPITGATVSVAGLSHAMTDKKGYAKIFIPYEYIYSLIIRYDGHEEVLYEENICPRKSYVYKADTQIKSGRIFILIPED